MVTESVLDRALKFAKDLWGRLFNPRTDCQSVQLGVAQPPAARTKPGYYCQRRSAATQATISCALVVRLFIE